MKKEKNIFKKKQVKLALDALIAHIESNPDLLKKKGELFESDEVFWLIFSFFKIPQVNNKPRKIPLPHPILEGREICFISSQPGSKVKEKFAKEGITNIAKVISLTKLRKEYKSFKQKRELCSSYDTFLCDEKIYHLVCKSFGKEFFKHKKDPLAVNMLSSNLKNEIDKNLRCTLLRMGHGPCSSLRVGCLKKQNEKEILENIIHAINVAVSKVPGSWKNIQKIYLKTTSTVSLPLFDGLLNHEYDNDDSENHDIEENKHLINEDKKSTNQKTQQSTPSAKKAKKKKSTENEKFTQIKKSPKVEKLTKSDESIDIKKMPDIKKSSGKRKRQPTNSSDGGRKSSRQNKIM